MPARHPAPLVVALSLALAAATAGCSSMDGGEWAPPPPQYEGNAQFQDGPVADEYVYEPPPVPQAAWECSYSPTYNNDWHDDVVCTNGSESTRPYLREWDEFITQQEIMVSARKYERQLNGTRND